MKITYKNGLQILTPESSDYILYSVNSNSYMEKVYLGKNDSKDNYREVEKALLEKEDSRVDVLEKTIKKQEEIIADLAKQLASLVDLMNNK
jgi:hypothetical protein